MARLCTAAAALLLLLTSARAAPTPDFPFALEEEACPPVPADITALFVTGGATDNATSLTRGQAANLACALLRLLDRAAAGNDSAAAALDAMHAAWRRAYRPQEWQAGAAGGKDAWLANLRSIAGINRLVTQRWWARLNAYSELTAEEFAATVLMRAGAATPSAAAAAVAPVGNRKMLARGGSVADPPPAPAYPPALNWTTAGKVLPAVGFQRQCGSSWAFAAAAALESRLMIGAGANTTAALSPQHIMDCAAARFAYNASACTGGSPADAFAFAAGDGVVADAGMRYRAEHGGADVASAGHLAQCARGFLTGQAAKAGGARVSGTPAYTAVTPASRLGMMAALRAAPAVVTLAVDPSFQHYHAGVYSSTTCQPGSSPTQSLLLVGYDTTRAGWELWLAKNSLGASWGEAGHVRLAMAEGDGLCGMYYAAVQPGAVTPTAPAKPGNGNGSGNGKQAESS